MADCAQLAELYEAYALGALDSPERELLEEHLARNCPQCVPQARTRALGSCSFGLCRSIRRCAAGFATQNNGSRRRAANGSAETVIAARHVG